jgi:hypothetical protein
MVFGYVRVPGIAKTRGRNANTQCFICKLRGTFSTSHKRGKRRGLAEPFPAFRAEYTYLPICFDSAHVLYLSCNFKS